MSAKKRIDRNTPSPHASQLSSAILRGRASIPRPGIGGREAFVRAVYAGRVARRVRAREGRAS